MPGILKRVVETAALMLAILILATGCIFLNSPPIASFTFTLSRRDPPCVVDFDASPSHDSDGIIVKYEWSFGDGSSGTGRSTSHTYTTSGTYTIDLKVTDDNGKTATKSETITILSTTPPTASFTASPTSGRAPLVVDFDASDSSDPDGHIISYDWDFGDGGTSTGVTVAHTYYSLGIYTATLTVTDNKNATSSASQVISATTQPPGPLYFSGQGAQISPSFTTTSGGATFYMEHAGRSYFTVILRYSPYIWVELLADETGNFSGHKHVTLDNSKTYLLDIIASGGWAIAVYGTTNYPPGSPPQTFMGRGQGLCEFSPLFALDPGRATFYFDGGDIVLLDYLRNTETPLLHEVDVLGGIYLLKIRASGDWEVSVEQ